MSGVPTWVCPVSATEPSARVCAAARSSSAVRPRTRSSLASELFGLATTATVGPLIAGRTRPLGFSLVVAKTTALVLGIVSKLVGKLAPLYDARAPNDEATVPAACRIAGDTRVGSTNGRVSA